MATATVLNGVGLVLLVVSGGILAYSADPLLDAMAKGLSPNSINIGRVADFYYVAELGGKVTVGAKVWRQRVRWGCVFLVAGFLFQLAALFV